MIFTKATKRGSYILEASISLPIFIIGILLLASIITIVAKCEAINYTLCDEMEKLQYEATINPVLLGADYGIETRVKKEVKVKSINASSRYLPAAGNYIYIDASSQINSKRIMDVSGKVNFEETILARAFVGVVRKSSPMTESEFGEYESYEGVFVCPNSGKRYHKRNCTYVNSYASRCKLTQEIKNKYKSCRLCKSSTVSLGQMVYYFEYGDGYHVRNCPTITKYVIEMDIKDAKEKGYTPCSKCGG